MGNRGDTAVSPAELLDLYERLSWLPKPTLDLSTETQTLDSLLAVGKELQHLAPQLVPFVCQMVLRELGRIEPAERERWIHSILPLAPPEDDAILRAILERVEPSTVFRWILELRDGVPDRTTKRLQSLFYAVSYQGAVELVEALGSIDPAQRALVEQPLPVLRSKIIAHVRPSCADATPEEAASLLHRLRLVGGRQVIPLVTQLLSRLDPHDHAALELAVTILGESGDPAAIPMLAPFAEHDDPRIRALVVDVLTRFDAKPAYAVLETQLLGRSLPLEEKLAILSRVASRGSEGARALVRKFTRPVLFNKALRTLRRHAVALLGETDAGRA